MMHITYDFKEIIELKPDFHECLNKYLKRAVSIRARVIDVKFFGDVHVLLEITLRS
jgi:hypothetical protein